MHELGMAKDLFRVILDKAAEKKLSRIQKVRIRVGEAAGIEKDFLIHSLKDHVFPGTPAKDCVIEIIPEKVSVVCSSCGRDLSGEAVFNCPECGGDDFKITGGKDVLVEDVDGVK
jgi:hydrogenase nickel insertion protein HypA